MEQTFTIVDQALDIPGDIVMCGERDKTMQTAERCWQLMLKKSLERDTTVIGIGGGATLDLAGFVAANYKRGVKLKFVPTTLLAMVDASIGGKNCVNLGNVKNIVGTFYEPDEIVLDFSYLKTLPKREFNAGMAEVIKIAFISDSNFFAELERGTTVESLVEKAIQLKKKVVAKDPFDKGMRAVLNFGHTFAHALELKEKFLHGEAVAIGMVWATQKSVRHGLCDQNTLDRLIACLKKYSLPTDVPEGDFVNLMRNDKKVVDGKLKLILTQGVGSATRYSCEWSDI